MRCLGLLVRVDRLGLRGFRLQRPDRLMRPGVWCILKKLVGLPGRRDRRGIPGLRVRKVSREIPEIPARRESKAYRVSRAFKVTPARKVLKVPRAGTRWWRRWLEIRLPERIRPL